MFAAMMISGATTRLTTGQTLLDAMLALARARASLVPVVDAEGGVLGVVTLRTIMDELFGNSAAPALPPLITNINGLAAKSVLTAIETDCVCITPQTPATEIASIFSRVNPPGILVVDDRKTLLGIITPQDFLDRLCAHTKTIKS